MAAGVLGMERTIAASRPSWPSKNPMVVPAAIERNTVPGRAKRR
jgi:hypothetical protein